MPDLCEIDDVVAEPRRTEAEVEFAARAPAPRRGPRRSPSPPRCAPSACACEPAHRAATRRAPNGPGSGARPPGGRHVTHVRRAPRGRRRTRPRARARFPRSSSNVRVVTRSSTWRSWVTSTSPPRCAARCRSNHTMASMSRWFVGSSRISTTSVAASPNGPTSSSARASATRLVSPPDNVAVDSFSRPPRPSRSRIAAASHPVPSHLTDRRPAERRVLVEHHDTGPAPAPDDTGLRFETTSQLAQQRRLARTVQPDDAEPVAVGDRSPTRRRTAVARDGWPPARQRRAGSRRHAKGRSPRPARPRPPSTGRRAWPAAKGSAGVSRRRGRWSGPAGGACPSASDRGPSPCAPRTSAPPGAAGSGTGRHGWRR